MSDIEIARKASKKNISEIASKLGWRITLIAPADEQKTIE